MWDDEGYDDYDYGGDVSTDDEQMRDWFDNGDGSWTDLATGEIWEGDELIGYDLGDGSGNWVDMWGFEYDEASGFWFDTLTGAWINEMGEVISYGGDGPSFPDSMSRDDDPSFLDSISGGTGTGDPGTGFWSAVGDFFKGIFSGGTSDGRGGGGSGGGGGGGFSLGGGSQSQSQAEQRAQQAQQQLARAQQQGAAPQQLAQLQQQALLTQQVAAALRSADSSKTFLIAGAVGLGVYALLSSRREVSRNSSSSPAYP